MKTLIKNGTVINATGSATADVLVDGEIIAALLNPDQAYSELILNGVWTPSLMPRAST